MPSRKSTIQAFLLLTLLPALANAAPVAQLYSAQGTVEHQSSESQAWAPVTKGQDFFAKESIRTKNHSRAAIRFHNGYVIRLKSNTSLLFKSQKKEEEELIVDKGAAFFFSRKKTRFPRIRTSHGSATIRGTEFVIDVTEKRTKISVLAGAVEAENLKGSIMLRPGEEGILRKNQAPIKQVIVDPKDSIQWAASFPGIIDPEELKSLDSKGKKALALYKSGEITLALKTIAGSDNNLSSKLLHLSLLLAAGEIEQATALNGVIENKLASTKGAELKRNRAIHQALLSVLALFQENNVKHAFATAKGAIAGDPESTTAMLALSLAHQARGEIEQATDWIENILNTRPNHVYALSKLAELQLAAGNKKLAATTVKQALNISPSDPYALVTSGFIHLSRLHTVKARGDFLKATRSGSHLALGKLGMGLALIKEGDLSSGRNRVEEAVALAPNISLYRSYLGKAYFEENNSSAAVGEYQRAIELDPEDPTPYLYRSFAHLSRNSPVRALEDVEKSIELNNNRAVFRSKLLLDEDSAVRSSGLSEVFARLGFGELARLEAISAIHDDYTNYSAHSLLSNSLDGLDNQQQASVSEVLISRLFQPVSYNSINPVGSSSASFNEYTPLFDRPFSRNKVRIEGTTEIDEATGTILYSESNKNLAWRLVFSADYSEEPRFGNIRSHSYRPSILGQYQLSENSILNWDLNLLLNERNLEFPNLIKPDSPQISQFDTTFGIGRISLSHKISSNTSVQAVLSIDHSEDDDSYENYFGRIAAVDISSMGASTPLSVFSLADLTGERSQTHSQADLQVVHKTDIGSFLLGTSVEHLSADFRESGNLTSVEEALSFDSSSALSFLEGYPLNSRLDSDFNTFRSFAYLFSHPFEFLDLSLGVNYSSIRKPATELVPYADFEDKISNWSPKLGFNLHLTKNTSLRGSYFETLGTSFIGQITRVEPTFVGGFNQIFDDFSAAKQEFYGVGIDHKVPNLAYFGVDYQRREIDQSGPIGFSVVFLDLDSFDITDGTIPDMQSSSYLENRIHGYGYLVFSPDLVGTVEATHYQLDEELGSTFTQKTITNRLEFGIKHFHRSGISSFAKAIWRQQELDEDIGFSNYTEVFWQADAGLSYQLPKRRGNIALIFNNIGDRESNQYRRIRGERRLLNGFGATLRASLNF